MLGHRGVELLLLKKVIGNQLETEDQAARDQPSAQLPDAFWKAVDFVPGSASVGELRQRHGERVQKVDGRLSCSAADCRCVCHLPRTSTDPPAGVNQPTNTHPPAFADKAVNTKARGLLHHNGGGSGGGTVRRTARSTSVDMVVLTGAAALQPHKQ